MDYQIVLSRSARSDLQNIVRYISLDDRDIAIRFGRHLISQTRTLAQFPQRGRVVPEFENNSVRELLIRTYRIVYRVDHDQHKIEVIRFWHAGRGVPKI